MADSRYNFSLTTFDKSGRLGQIDHALKAVENGNTSLGIKGGQWRSSNPNLPPSAVHRIHEAEATAVAHPHEGGAPIRY